jgi:putative RecB family exonuclease
MSATEPTYSFSRVTTFEQCARRFRYRYLDGVKEAFSGVEAFMGQRVHEVIEWLFNERDAGRSHSAEVAVKRYCDEWDREIVSGSRVVRVIKRGIEMETYRSNGARMLARFHAERFLRDRLVTIENEKHFKIRIGDKFGFQGFIDRLARNEDGLVHIIDYKTGRQPRKSFGGKEADQLSAYALALFLETDEAELELVLEFLRTGDRLHQRVSRDEAAAVEADLVERIAAAEASTVFPPTPGILCDWCGYNDLCDAPAGRRSRG